MATPTAPIVSDGSQFLGASTPNKGTTSSNDLNRDVHVGVLEAFKRKTIIADLIDSRTIVGGTGAQFIVEGKEDKDDTQVDEYFAGNQVVVNNGTQDEIVIPLDRPQYTARRIDDWDAAVASYDIMSMNQRQVGSKLMNVVDRKAVAAVVAAGSAVDLIGNGTSTIVANAAIATGTALERGDALCESIYAAAAAIRENDDYSDLFVMLTPTNYSYVVQSSRSVNTDFTNGNGGFDSGIAYEVGGVKLVQTNNFPATSGLEAVVFGNQAAGIVKLWDIKTRVVDDADFLSAKRLQAFFSNGMGPLRAQSCCLITSA